MLLTLPIFFNFFIEFSLKIYLQISDQVSVLKRYCQGIFGYVIENTSSCVSKIFNCNQRDPKLKKKNVWKPSLEAVLAKFNKLTSGTKNCAQSTSRLRREKKSVVKLKKKIIGHYPPGWNFSYTDSLWSCGFILYGGLRNLSQYWVSEINQIQEHAAQIRNSIEFWRVENLNAEDY